LIPSQESGLVVKKRKKRKKSGKEKEKNSVGWMETTALLRVYSM
jgi:hypothetical protein